MTRTRTLAPDAAWTPPEPERLLPLAEASLRTMGALVSALSPAGPAGRHITRREARRLLTEAETLAEALRQALGHGATPHNAGAQSPDQGG